MYCANVPCAEHHRTSTTRFFADICCHGWTWNWQLHVSPFPWPFRGGGWPDTGEPVCPLRRQHAQRQTVCGSLSQEVSSSLASSYTLHGHTDCSWPSRCPFTQISSACTRCSLHRLILMQILALLLLSRCDALLLGCEGVDNRLTETARG